MPRYTVKAPDGRTVTIEGPSPPTEADIADLDAAFADLPPAAPDVGMGPSLGGAEISSAPWYAKPMVSGESVQRTVEAMPGVPPLGSEAGPALRDAIPPMGPSFLQATGAIPAITGTLGGILGAAGTGGLATMGGAALGGAGGEALRQLIRRALGASAPETSMEAAEDIGMEGLIQGGAQAVGAGLGAFLRGGGRRMVQSAMKPTASVLKEYRTTPQELTQTLLDEGITVSSGGLSKLQGILRATNAEIKAAVAASPGTIPKSRVAAQTAPVARKLSQQVNPSGDLADLGKTVEDFLNHPTFQGDLTIPEAQAMKIGTYKQIGKKYGQISSAAVETEKALARGLKEEVAAAVPEIAALNAKEGSILAAQDAVGRRVALSGNRDPVGFAWVASNPSTFLLALMDRSTSVKSLLGRGMFKAAGTAANVPPALIRAAVVTLAEEEE